MTQAAAGLSQFSDTVVVGIRRAAANVLSRAHTPWQ